MARRARLAPLIRVRGRIRALPHDRRIGWCRAIGRIRELQPVPPYTSASRREGVVLLDHPVDLPRRGIARNERLFDDLRANGKLCRPIRRCGVDVHFARYGEVVRRRAPPVSAGWRGVGFGWERIGRRPRLVTCKVGGKHDAFLPSIRHRRIRWSARGDPKGEPKQHALRNPHGHSRWRLAHSPRPAVRART